MSMTSDDLLSNFPTAGTADGDKPSPLGVPDDFVASVPIDRTGMTADAAERIGPVRAVAPTFWDGDDWKPASQPPEQIARVQQQLVNAGLLTGSYRIGMWDEPTRKAYRTVLEYANSVGETDDARALARLASLPRQEVAPAATPRAPLTVRVSNPADVERVLRSAFRDALGSGAVAEDDVRRMVAAYQNKEADFQRQARSVAETGGTLVEPPSLETFADEQAKATDPTAYDSRKVISGLQHVFSMFDGGA